MAYWKLCKHSFCLLFIIFCFNAIYARPASDAKPDSALLLWQKSINLRAEANYILQQIESEENISDNDSITIHEKIAALSLLLESKQLKEDYYLFVIDSISQTSTLTEEHQNLYNTIRSNLDSELGKIRPLIDSSKAYNKPDSVLAAYEAALVIQDRGLAGYKLQKAILEWDNTMTPYFTNPIDVKKISARYGIPETDVLFLTASSELAEEFIVTEADTITKGYSPFTSEYKDFVFDADSIAKARSMDSLTYADIDTLPGLSNFKIDTTLQNQLTQVWNQNFQHLRNDSLFIQAAKDSLFPHEMITMYDMTSLRRYWAIYLNQWTDLAQLESLPATESQVPDAKQELALVDVPEQKTNEAPLIVKSEFDSRQSTEKPITDNIDSKQTISGNTPVTNLMTPVVSDETLYFVQIAASREPMNQSFISTFYKGNDSIYTRFEENWYKYQIGKTPHFSEALKTLNRTDIKGAFIVPYAGGEKLVLWKTLQPKSSIVPNKVLTDLTFVVQLAASRDQLSAFQVKQLTKKVDGVVREIEEDKWFKYQLIIGPSYTEAKRRWQQIGVTKSFIVPYFNNEKIEMKEAFRILKGN